MKNQKVIGIHKGAAHKGKEYNYGTYLKLPIEEFNEFYNDNCGKNIKKGKNKELENYVDEYDDEDKNSKTCKVVLIGESNVSPFYKRYIY